MDFFQHQETARRRTGLLIAYFTAAVILIVILTYAVVAVGIQVARPHKGPQPQTTAALWDPALFAIVATATIMLIGGGSMYRIASLAGGGSAVAEMMGGRPVLPQTTDPDERKILNVVEEMAIASGTPVPPVYLLEHEGGINAFAAGHAPGDAVIGVTRGCIRNLTRDELQGVIAHEFSHILNGDMRLNLRLIGVLYGILLVSMTGWLIFRTTAGSGSRDSGDGDRKGGNPWPLVGLALYVLGYVGVFFGNLIKAAVSRQREFLADASAVQFTRNPDGIAGALKKIGALAQGSRVQAPEAQEASHMFFGDAVGHLLGAFATHPPLVERIRRIDPAFDGDFSRVRLAPAGSSQPGPHGDGVAAAAAAAAAVVRDGAGRFRLDPSELVAHVGTLGPGQIAYAASMITALPSTLADLVHEPSGARAVVYALLLDRDDEAVRGAQLDRLGASAGPSSPSARRQVEGILPVVRGLAPEQRLPLVAMAVPALKQLSRDQLASFQADVRDLVRSDGQVSLFEYAVERLLRRHLAGARGPATTSGSGARGPGRPDAAARYVLGALAHVGSASPSDAARAFAVGLRTLGLANDNPAPPPGGLDFASLDRALDELDAVAPQVKRRVLAACAACIASDGRVTAEEGELLRAVADALGCPVPPLPSFATAATTPVPAATSP